MAITKLGDLVTGIRGSVGGVTYSRNGAGTYVRAWARGPQSNSADSQVGRANMAKISQLWATINDGERADWNGLNGFTHEIFYNSLGEEITLSGFQLFCTLLLRGLSAGESVYAFSHDAAAPTVRNLVSFSASNAGTYTLTWDGDTEWISTGFLAVKGAWLNAAVTSVGESRQRVCGFVPAFSGNSVDLKALITGKLGTPPVGARLSVWVYHQLGYGPLQGWRSPALTATATVTA